MGRFKLGVKGLGDCAKERTLSETSKKKTTGSPGREEQASYLQKSLQETHDLLGRSSFCKMKRLKGDLSEAQRKDRILRSSVGREDCYSSILGLIIAVSYLLSYDFRRLRMLKALMKILE